jgi:N-acyl-D-aspartate/D-glutamate deacylase
MSMILLKNGRVFDGSKKPSFIGSVLVDEGKVLQVLAQNEALPEGTENLEVIDATNCWITPGFIDTHTHYDFELLVNPALSESVRHGVTTVVAGSCSITAIMAEAEDCSDIFTRVEGVPREQVLPILKDQKLWHRPKEYVAFLDDHPLGANVCSYIGHSDIRIAAMGIENSVEEDRPATAEEMTFMKEALQEAMDVGFLGMSSMQTDGDRLDGDRVRSKALPSVYASFKEYSALNKILRESKGILQTAPDIRNPLGSMLHLAWELTSFFRRQLRITSIVMMDGKASRKKPLGKLQLLFSKAVRILGGDFRWQTLPCEFHVRIQGMNFVIFEEVPSGATYLHLSENADRDKLVSDPAFKKEFIKNMTERFRPALWNRDIGDGHVYQCPDQSIIGLSFAEIAKRRNIHVAEVFVDLLVEYGNQLIWKLVIGNERDDAINDLYADRTGSNLMSFSDAGAHIQNMANYHFPRQMLARLKNMRKNGLETISDEHAIHRLSGELADWHGIDTGYIKKGARADINVINPENLHHSLDSIVEADFDGIENFTRLVNRNDGIVNSVLINGKVAVRDDQCVETLGKSMGYGSFLRAS